MKFVVALKNQLRRIWPSLVLGLATGLLATLGGYVVSRAGGFPPAYLTMDPAALGHFPFFLGILSNVGVLLWSAAGAICLFAAAILFPGARTRPAAWFLVWSGLLSLLLTLDDLLLFHEQVFPEQLGIPQPVVVAIYAALVATYLVRFARRILATDYLLLLVALGWFTLSVGVDQGFPPGPQVNFLDDSFKFFGIVFWLAYFTRTAARLLRETYAVESESFS